MKKPHLIVDVALCQGCHNCFLACKDEHVGNDWPGYSRPQSLHGERWIEVPCRERGSFPLVDVAYRPLLCTHCDDAPCVADAKGAITKRADGIVLIDPDKARGRPELVDACPYGTIVWNEEFSVPQKCTLCAHLLDAGWAQPRCVQACGPGALAFVWEEDGVFAKRAATEDLETLHLGSPEETVVCYKNLGRFDSCFIAGSVAIERDGVVDCVAGCAATLKRTALTAGVAGQAEVVQTVLTDTFGDFKFDGLKPGSGEHVVEIAAKGIQPLRVSVSVGDNSVNLGTITIRRER